MWPLRVGPLNTLNGMRDSELPSTASADSANGKRSLDNTLVMSFVEHTIVLTLTGEEVNLLYSNTKELDKITDIYIQIYCCSVCGAYVTLLFVVLPIGRRNGNCRFFCGSANILHWKCNLWTDCTSYPYFCQTCQRRVKTTC